MGSFSGAGNTAIEYGGVKYEGRRLISGVEKKAEGNKEQLWIGNKANAQAKHS
jgi:hypothetical protein